MEMYLQFGHGMKEHCKCLFRRWGGGTVILSPRDLTQDQLQRFAKEIIEVNGRILLDPQLYNPRATHSRLTNHDYWPRDFMTGMLLGGPGLNRILMDLRELNGVAQASEYIIPGIYCERVDDDWLAIQESINEEASSVFTDKRRLATICLSSEALRFEEQVEAVLSSSELWNVDGYYVVAEHPKGHYLVDDPLWLTNLLILCSGLKLQEREVLVGYSNHQMLSLAAANIDAIASGTWLNVRSFPPDKFQENEDDSPSRRATWYYCPQSLSEYKPAFLDMGLRVGILDQLRTDISFDSEFADVLFSGALPSSTAFSEQQAFRHYLQCLKVQSVQARKSSFKETLDMQLQILEIAKQQIATFHNVGVMGQDRDFADIIDVNQAALLGLKISRGFVLERQW